MRPNGEILRNPYNGVYLAPWNLERGDLSETDPTIPIPGPRVDSMISFASGSQVIDTLHA